MKKSRTLIVLFVTLGILLVAYFIFNASDNRRFQWYETYHGDSDQPYGTSFVRQLLESYRPGADFIYNKKRPIHKVLDSVKFKTSTDYIFIGPSDNLNQEDVEALVNFINRGNDVFIASLDPPSGIVEKIYKSNCFELISYKGYTQDLITFNFYHDTLKNKKGYQYNYQFAGIDCPYYWNYLDSAVFCNGQEALVPIGYQGGNLVNFFKIPHGKGNLYLHSNPLVFTNYYLTKTDKMEYAAGVFSHLKGRDIIWDEYSKLPFEGNNNGYNSPLYFIMEQPSLKYAWWMILITVAMFVSFAAKRKQRIIPVLEVKTNTSLEFVTMISSLHYQNEDHLDMARKKMRYFLYFIRAKYGIHTPAFTQVHVSLLSEKSKVKETDIQHIFDRWNVIDRFGNSSIEVHRLVDLYYAIDSFYKQCR